MTGTTEWRPNPECYGVPRIDPGWIYAVKNGALLKVGRTRSPNRRLFGEGRTWVPDLEVIGVKPFWNFQRIERSLHCALAEHWYRGEWHKFDDVYWLDFFVDAFSEFEDADMDVNSARFAHWVIGTNYIEIVAMCLQYKMPLRKWQQCHADPCSTRMLPRRSDHTPEAL